MRNVEQHTVTVEPYMAYQQRPTSEGFNWSDILEQTAVNSAYLVAFRSTRTPDADVELLNYLDEQAHEEALESDGLLVYFQGEATEQGECVSFCLWENPQAARKASQGPKHQAAIRSTASMYEQFTLERYTVKRVKEQVLFERSAAPIRQ